MVNLTFSNIGHLFIYLSNFIMYALILIYNAPIDNIQKSKINSNYKISKKCNVSNEYKH